MKPAEVRQMTDEELRKELDTQRESLFRLRFRQETEQVQNAAERRKVKKDIARMLTILKQRELEQARRPESPS